MVLRRRFCVTNQPINSRSTSNSINFLNLMKDNSYFTIKEGEMSQYDHSVFFCGWGLVGKIIIVVDVISYFWGDLDAGVCHVEFMFEFDEVKLRSHFLWFGIFTIFVVAFYFLRHLSVYLVVKSLFGVVVGIFELAGASRLGIEGCIPVLLHVFEVIASIYDIFASEVNSHVHPFKNLAEHHTILFHLFFRDALEVLFQEHHLLVYFVFVSTWTHWVVRTNLEEELFIN